MDAFTAQLNREPEYALLKDAFGESRHARTPRIPDLSLAKLISIVDEAFVGFLRERAQSESTVARGNPDTYINWEKLTTQHKLSDAVRQIFGGEFDFTDSRPLTAQQLMDTLCRLSQLGHLACSQLQETLETHPYAAGKQVGSS